MRHKDVNWNLEGCGADNRLSRDQVQIALLMDLRDELRQIRSDLVSVRSIVNCHNAIDIPRKLDRIVKNTAKKRTKPKT